MRTLLTRLVAVLFGAAMIGTAIAPTSTAADPPDTVLTTYTWSHTAHLASFNFMSPDDPLATFQCSLTGPGEAPAWTACDRPTSHQYAKLAVGVYLVRVRAMNANGIDPTPASRLFNIGVDAVPPVTSLTTTAKTTSRNATFTFTSNEPGSTFECTFLTNGKGDPYYTPCTSPVTYTGLKDAKYQFTVRAIDASGEYDSLGKRHTWLLDATPPETSLSGYIDGLNASFGFTQSDGNPECSLAGPSKAHSWRACSSPTKYAALKPGSYTFKVRARDRHGNVDPTPATYRWRARPKAPRVTGGTSFKRGQSATFRISSPDRGARFDCKLDKGRWKSCRTTHKVSTRTLTASKRGTTHVLRVRAKVSGVAGPTTTKSFRVYR